MSEFSKRELKILEMANRTTNGLAKLNLAGHLVVLISFIALAFLSFANSKEEFFLYLMLVGATVELLGYMQERFTALKLIKKLHANK